MVVVAFSGFCSGRQIYGHEDGLERACASGPRASSQSEQMGRGVDEVDGGPGEASTIGFALNGRPRLSPLMKTLRAGLGTGGPLFDKICMSFRRDSLEGISLMGGAAIGEEIGFGPDRMLLVGLGEELPSALAEA